jgi:hypothetical protein
MVEIYRDRRVSGSTRELEALVKLLKLKLGLAGL